MTDTALSEPAPQPKGAKAVPWELVVPEADLYLVGYGMRMPNDFTLEMLAILKQCKRILGGPPIDLSAFGIPPMEDLLLHYDSTKPRLQTYRDIEALVLEAAAESGPVAFATYGSTMFGTYPAHRLLQEAPRRGLRVYVSNAVSSLEGLWAGCNIEPFFGFEVWEATCLVALEIEPNTRANLVLPQAPIFEIVTGTDQVTRKVTSSSTIARLRDYLLQFYPSEHPVHFVTTGHGVGAGAFRTNIETVRLEDLDHPGSATASTLLVPRRSPFGVQAGAQMDFEHPPRSFQRKNGSESRLEH